MSEVKSAREVAESILDKAFDFDVEADIYKMDAIIRADRHAIIEKCKEAIQYKRFIPNEDGTFTELPGWAINDISRTLDSVLSDLEKEE